MAKIFVAACVLVLFCGLVLAVSAATKTTLSPITIDVPGVKADVVSLQTAGSWPLSIRMLANDPLGIGTYAVPYQFPIGSQQAFIVFADPDGCFSLSLYHDPAGANPCPGGTDETYLEFTPTINLPDLVKQRVNAVPAARLGAAPSLLGWTPEGGNTEMFTVGPGVGSSPDDGSVCDDSGANVGCDNYGYGASPNVPGLVILSDTGVGLVWDPDSFNLVTPRRARNLAGLVNSVAWTLNDCTGWKGLVDGCSNGRTGVTAHMNVPADLFTPVVRIDFGHPADGGLSTGRSYRIDGGDWVDDDTGSLRDVLNSRITTLRVFVVSGRGPRELRDIDGNNVVNAKDAVLAGYTLLSDEKLVLFRTWHQEEEAALGIPYDRNGDGMTTPPAPAGSGDITQVPR